ncbi:hypothetical protein D3C83_50900 [compost metagenome]
MSASRSRVWANASFVAALVRSSKNLHTRARCAACELPAPLTRAMPLREKTESILESWAPLPKEAPPPASK